MLHNNDASVTGTSASDCANDCNDPTILSPCNAFDFCPATATCSLSKTHTEDGTLAPSPAKCDHYTSKRAYFLLGSPSYLHVL